MEARLPFVTGRKDEDQSTVQDLRADRLGEGDADVELVTRRCARGEGQGGNGTGDAGGDAHGHGRTPVRETGT